MSIDCARRQVVLGEPIGFYGGVLVLARISGGPTETPLEVTGPIAGMSGSPIFVGCTVYEECLESGTLVGALSYGFTIIPQGGMNTGITPAEEMLGSRSAGYVAAEALTKNTEHGDMTRPLLLSLPPDIPGLPGPGRVYNAPIAAMQSRNKSMSDYCSKKTSSREIRPGSMIAVPIADGDVIFAAAGTVTWRDGDTIWAFGHPFFGSGSVRYPFRHVSVAATIQSTIYSYKTIGCEAGEYGTITVDGATEISGTVGKEYPRIPLRITLRAGQKDFTLQEEVADTPYTRIILSVLPRWWVRNLVGIPERVGLRYQARIALKGEPEVFLKNTIADGSRGAALGEFFLTVGDVISMLETSGFPFEFESVRLEIELIENVALWQEEKVFLSEKKAKPGETVTLSIVLRKFPEANEFRQIDFPITIPSDFFELPNRSPVVNISVRDGGRHMNALTPKSPADLLNSLMAAFQGGGNAPGGRYFQKRARTIRELIRKINEANLPADTVFIYEAFSLTETEEAASRSEPGPSSMAWRAVADPEPDNVFAESETRKFALPPVDGAAEVNEFLTLIVEKPIPQTEQKTRELPAKSKKPLWRKLLPFV